METISATFFDGFQEYEIDNNKNDLCELLKDFSQTDLQDLISLNFKFEDGFQQIIPIPQWLNENVKYMTQSQYITRYVIYCETAKKLGIQFRHSDD